MTISEKEKKLEQKFIIISQKEKITQKTLNIHVEEL